MLNPADEAIVLTFMYYNSVCGSLCDHRHCRIRLGSSVAPRPYHLSDAAHRNSRLCHGMSCGLLQSFDYSLTCFTRRSRRSKPTLLAAARYS